MNVFSNKQNYESVLNSNSLSTVYVQGKLRIDFRDLFQLYVKINNRPYSVIMYCDNHDKNLKCKHFNLTFPIDHFFSIIDASITSKY